MVRIKEAALAAAEAKFEAAPAHIKAMAGPYVAPLIAAVKEQNENAFVLALELDRLRRHVGA